MWQYYNTLPGPDAQSLPLYLVQNDAYHIEGLKKSTDFDIA